MRYRSDEGIPDPDFPYSEGMHSMLTLSMGLSILIGVVLLYLGVRGRIMWLSWWSGGLIICALAYLVGELVGLF